MANHRQIAAACGVSTATVSRALAGHPHVRGEVRRRVAAAARRLGYAPDPRLAYLSRLRWGRGRKPDSVTIAVLCDRFTSRGTDKFRALARRAGELGYQLDVVPVEGAAAAGRNLGREFFHRGIQGLLINLHDPSALPEVDWNRFSVVMVGEERPELAFHRVGTDWRQAFDLVCERAWARGHRRIGFSLARFEGTELNRLMLGEALLHRDELRGRGRAAPPLFRFGADAPGVREAYEGWRREHRVACVIANNGHPFAWREAAGRRRPEILHVCLTEALVAAGAEGADARLGPRFAAALRLLHEMMLVDRRGFAPESTRTLYPVVLRAG